MMDLPKINDALQIKFTLVLVGTNYKHEVTPVFSKFRAGDVDYLRFNPHPFITLDFNPKKRKNDDDTAWNRNRSLNLTQPSAFRFKKLLKQVLDSIKIPEMFNMYDGVLKLNNALAQKHTVAMKLGDKFVKIAPIVVEDDSGANPDLYEGIVLYVNDISFYVCLTYIEAEYLYDVIDKINFQSLTMELINSAILLKSQESKQLVRMITEVKEPEPEEQSVVPQKKDSFEGIENIEI